MGGGLTTLGASVLLSRIRRVVVIGWLVFGGPRGYIEMQGLWKCESRSLANVTEGYHWVRYGRNRAPHRGCGRWNVYVSRVPHPKKIDTHCRWCSRRVQWNPVRKSLRGDFRPVFWVGYPHSFSVSELVEDMSNLNARMGSQKFSFEVVE